jgi:hypothetical protein
LFCAVIWWGLASPAKIAGSIWLLGGLVIMAVRTRWFSKPIRLPDPAIYD